MLSILGKQKAPLTRQESPLSLLLPIGERIDWDCPSPLSIFTGFGEFYCCGSLVREKSEALYWQNWERFRDFPPFLHLLIFYLMRGVPHGGTIEPKKNSKIFLEE